MDNCEYDHLHHVCTIKVVGRGLPRYKGFAIVVAAVFLVIGIVCIVHRVTRVRRKINFEVI